MLNKKFFLLFFLLFPLISFSSSCSLNVEANGMMQFDTKSIEIDSSCSEFNITLKNTGDLDVKLAGHNIVITKASDFEYVTSIVNPAEGLDTGYLPKDSKVLFKTKFLGPNEATTLKINTDKLQKNEKYTFFCSFLGHWGVMKGDLVLK